MHVALIYSTAPMVIHNTLLSSQLEDISSTLVQSGSATCIQSDPESCIFRFFFPFNQLQYAM